MHHFIEIDDKTGEVVGYLQSSSPDMLPNPRSEAHRLVEVTDEEQIQTMRALKPGVGMLQATLKNGKIATLHRDQPPMLRLTAKKTELVGDGEDMAEIIVEAVNSDGKPVTSCNAAVLVTTERGRLSERGGRITLKKGTGRITLTSVNETVHRVRVRAVSPEGALEPADLLLEFV